MSDADKGQTKVTDRRRFDRNGNPIQGFDSEDEAQLKEAAGAPRGESAEASPGEAQRAAPGADAQDASAPESSPELQKVTQELEVARNRVNELARAYQALNQDREEFKQRLSRERERMIDVEKGKVALTLLEAIDDLDLSLQAAGDTDQSPLAKGVRLIRDGLLAKVQGMGLQRLSLVGQTFDPNVAEAADMEMTTTEAEDQSVLSEIRAGYKLGDRVIRPARVKVAKYVKPAKA